MLNPIAGPVQAFKRGDRTEYTALVCAPNEDGTVDALVYSTASQPSQEVTLRVIKPGAAAPADAEWWCEMESPDDSRAVKKAKKTKKS